MSTVATILAAVGYRLGGGITISATSNPTQATCIQWLNETALWITGVCAEQKSDLGRVIGTVTTLYPAITAATQANPCAVTSASHGLTNSDEILIRSVSGMTDLNDKEYTFTKTSDDAGTIGVNSSAYSAYTSGGYMSKRIYSTLATTLYTPDEEGWIVSTYSRDSLKLRPSTCIKDYNPVECVQPDAFYIDGSNNVCFPVYPDAAYTVKIPYWKIPTAMTATSDTMPFLGLMDNVFIEALAIRAQNRDEYDLSFEIKWQSFLLDRVKAVIAMRKGMNVSVSL